MDGLGAFSSGTYGTAKPDGQDPSRTATNPGVSFNDGFSATSGHEAADLIDMESIEGRGDQPQQLADLVFEAICKDIEEKPTSKGNQAFRDKVFENCSPQEISLRNVRYVFDFASTAPPHFAIFTLTALIHPPFLLCCCLPSCS